MTRRMSTADETRAVMREWVKEAVDLYHRDLAWARFLKGGPAAVRLEWFQKNRLYTLSQWLCADWGMSHPYPKDLNQVADILDEARTISARRRVKALPRP